MLVFVEFGMRETLKQSSHTDVMLAGTKHSSCMERIQIQKNNPGKIWIHITRTVLWFSICRTFCIDIS